VVIELTAMVIAELIAVIVPVVAFPFVGITFAYKAQFVGSALGAVALITDCKQT